MNAPKGRNDHPLRLTLNTKGAAAVFACPVPTLRALVEAGGIDPKRDFRGADLRGWPLARQDVRGFNFAGANLCGTGIENAIFDSTTIFDDALFDGAFTPTPPPPLPDNYREQATEMILRSKIPPAHWWPEITWLDFFDRKLVDLTPIAHLTALNTLYLRGTQVSDLTPLAHLTALQVLELNRTQVSDLTPLTHLTALQSLNLNRTQVSDLTPLAQLTALQNLTLWDTQISDISPLAHLTALQSLNLNRTQISDLTPLTLLTALQTLYLRGTYVRDITILAQLTALRSLYLWGTQVSDIAALSSHSGLIVWVESDDRAKELRATLAARSHVRVKTI